MRLFLGVCVFLICSAHAAYCCYEKDKDPQPAPELSPVDIGPWIYDLDRPSRDINPSSDTSGNDYMGSDEDFEPIIFDEEEQ
jgi:hypothetical protein